MYADNTEPTAQTPGNGGLKSIWQWPFLRTNGSGLTPITGLALSEREDAPEDQADARQYHGLHLVDEGLVELLGQLDGVPAAPDADFDLEEADADWLQDDLVLDWGDEYEGEGLSFAELRKLKQVKSDTWQLADGRFLRFYFLQRASLTLATADEATEPPCTLRPNSLAQEMAERYAGGDLWGQHPRYPRRDWKAEVDNDDTILGYWEWVLHSLEVNADDEEADTESGNRP